MKLIPFKRIIIDSKLKEDEVISILDKNTIAGNRLRVYGILLHFRRVISYYIGG
jgi:hypothetical protein